MQFGINLLLWTDTPYAPEFLPLYERLKKMGYDGVELPMFSGNPEDYRKLGERLRDLGLERTATVIRNEDDDPISPDPAVRQTALQAMKHAVDCADAAGAALVGGPFYAAIGKFSGAPPTTDEWSHSVDYMRQAADYAQNANIHLSLEFLNRFEIYLLNCTADTARFVREVDRPNVGVHYDTFHANLEEKNVTRAIQDAASAITHVHISENDRGTPGQGQVRWQETFAALAAIGYDGWLTIEAFGQALPGLAAATKIWRPLFESEEKLAADGLAFMRQHAGGA
ncbi:MAG: sugar phosphate isomerase/epimerase [Candidatus Binatia bacterium]|nr:sugar phosphate isomerase/epimerase [Candidatus Binatia bacterium]MDG1959019.1 sugar phosphate isomerase/epimerase [Candidatus Binatia bacterium]MDG2008603.1 sugar phosphate isomerase/epimerase [Candidatus Binatia bacterium]